MAKGHCPACQTQINLGKSLRKGQTLECYRCGESLEIVALSPIELDFSLEDPEQEEAELEDEIGEDF